MSNCVYCRCVTIIIGVLLTWEKPPVCGLALDLNKFSPMDLKKRFGETASNLVVGTITRLEISKKEQNICIL